MKRANGQPPLEIDEHDFLNRYRNVPLQKHGIRFTLLSGLESRQLFCPPPPDEPAIDRIKWMAETLFENGALDPRHHFLLAQSPEEV